MSFNSNDANNPSATALTSPKKSKFKQYSREKLNEAVATVTQSKKSLRAAALMHGIPRSTLQRYVKQIFGHENEQKDDDDDDDYEANLMEPPGPKRPREGAMFSGPHRTLSCEIRAIASQSSYFMDELIDQMIKRGEKIYKLDFGQSPFPIPECVVEQLRKNANQRDYLQVSGLPELREKIATWAVHNMNLKITAKDVLIGPGTKELLFVLQCVYYADLLIPNPSFISYAPQAKIAGRNMFWLTTLPDDRWILKPEILEALCEMDPDAPRVLIFNSPCNPTGMAYTDEELKAVAEVARKYRLLVVSDEIYGPFHHAGHHVSISRFYPEGTIVSGGLSKWMGAGGWRIGYWLFPPKLQWLRRAMLAMISETYTSVASPIQYAAMRAFDSNCEDLKSYSFRSRYVLRIIGTWCANELIKINIDVQIPEGAFYLFPDFKNYSKTLQARGIYDDAELCRKLLHDTGVALLPGSVFGRAPSELYARLAYVDFNGGLALERVTDVMNSDVSCRDEAITMFIRECCPNIHDAIYKIIKWLINGPIMYMG